MAKKGKKIVKKMANNSKQITNKKSCKKKVWSTSFK